MLLTKSFLKVWCLVAAVLLPGATTAAADEFDGRPITAVSVSGLRNIKEAIVLDQIESQPGRPYSAETAAQDIKRLERLKVFSDVSVTPIPIDAGVRLDIVVVETIRVFPAVSVGVSDESGTSIGPAVKVLSVGGRPHEVSASVRFGGEGLVELSDTSPYLTHRRFWFSNKLSIRERENGLDHFKEHSLEYDGRFGPRLSASWKTGLIFQSFNLESHESGITLSPDNTDAFPGLGGIVEYDTRDSWTTPTRGWLNSVDAVWRGGDGNYDTLNVDVRRYQPITTKQTLVATALLTLQSGVRGEDIPTYVDYALGGSNSVRGWEFASRRGKNQLIVSLEHRYTVVPTRAFRLKGLNLYGGIAFAVFADGGSAWNEAGEWNDNTIGGAGIGLRVFVPFLDVIRLDLAVGHNSHSMIGINEKAVAQRNRVR